MGGGVFTELTMLIDATLPPTDLNAIPSLARAAESMGFNVLWSTETMHDPFLPGALIAEHTHKLFFGTAVAIAFARSPATLAYTAWDLAQASGGRFILGLGTQVKAHIVRRFGMPWPESVVGKLREQIEAIHAFWNTWQTNQPLNYLGEYYKLNLMSSYRPVMELHGWEDIASQLSALAASGSWTDMAGLIDDDMLREFAVIASPADLPSALLESYQGLVDRLGLYIPFMPGERDEFWKHLLQGV
jgi:alkanesulfonate monooxygenase SsuD/methylene tetrahydromethanopterin reductase-like flavin-dependent oxidoreductase (luciferase family)